MQVTRGMLDGSLPVALKARQRDNTDPDALKAIIAEMEVLHKAR